MRSMTVCLTDGSFANVDSASVTITKKGETAWRVAADQLLYLLLTEQATVVNPPEFKVFDNSYAKIEIPVSGFREPTLLRFVTRCGFDLVDPVGVSKGSLNWSRYDRARILSRLLEILGETSTSDVDKYDNYFVDNTGKNYTGKLERTGKDVTTISIPDLGIYLNPLENALRDWLQARALDDDAKGKFISTGSDHLATRFAVCYPRVYVAASDTDNGYLLLYGTKYYLYVWIDVDGHYYHDKIPVADLKTIIEDLEDNLQDKKVTTIRNLFEVVSLNRLTFKGINYDFDDLKGFTIFLNTLKYTARYAEAVPQEDPRKVGQFNQTYFYNAYKTVMEEMRPKVEAAMPTAALDTEEAYYNAIKQYFNF